MTIHPLDAPQITSNLFYPRPAAPAKHPAPNTFDGTIPVAEGIVLGYRYFHAPDKPVIVYFHGNGEIASDYDLIAPIYQQAGAGLLVIDYRGYGWSTGTPLTSQLLPDALKALGAVPTILQQHGAKNPPLFIKGRSLGSAPAVYLALMQPDMLRGLMLDSAYADAPSLFRRLGIALPDKIQDDIALPLYNVQKMQQIHLPLLVLHGENDTLIPAAQGQALYDASPATDKRLVLISRAGHNDVMVRDIATYFGAVREFVQKFAG
jgi:alpha-beta hydrolase superfamily lysophospholipase